MQIWLGYLDKDLGKRFIITTWILLIAAVAAANAFWTTEGMKGILLGGIVANLNTIGVFRDTKRLMKWRRQFVYYIGAITRLILAGVIILTFLKKFPGQFSIIGIFIGVSIIPLSFFMLLLQMLLKGVVHPPHHEDNGE